MSAHNFVPQDDYNVRLCAICGCSKSQCLATKEETLEEIARRIASKDFIARQDLAGEILSALRNEREACAKKLDTRVAEISNYQTRPYRVARRELEAAAAAIRERTE